MTARPVDAPFEMFASGLGARTPGVLILALTWLVMRTLRRAAG